MRPEIHIQTLKLLTSSARRAARPLGTLLALAIIALLGVPRSADLAIPAIPVEEAGDQASFAAAGDESHGGGALEEGDATHTWLDADAASGRLALKVSLAALRPQHTPPIVVPPPRTSSLQSR